MFLWQSFANLHILFAAGEFYLYWGPLRVHKCFAALEMHVLMQGCSVSLNHSGYPKLSC